MRYEFERDGTVVASVLWEGPGQVDGRGRRAVHPLGRRPLPQLRGGLPGLRVRLRRGAGAGRAADAPSRLDPVGVRARVPQPGAPPAGARPAGRDRPGRSSSGGGDAMTKMSGAEALLKALEQEGVENVFGIPGGASMPIYDPLVDRSLDPPHPVPSRAGRRPRRRGLRLGHRQGRRVHGHQRPRRHEPGHAARRRQDGLGADRRHHRPGADAGDRQRRLPGSRHHRHHDADHEAPLPGEGPRRHRARPCARRSTSPRPAGPARC